MQIADHKEVNMLYNAVNDSMLLQVDFFLLYIVAIASFPLMLVRGSTEGMFIFMIPMFIMIMIVDLGVMRLFIGLATSFTTSSVNHKQVYKEARFQLGKENQLKVKTWATFTFYAAKALEINNQQFLTIMNDYVMNLFLHCF